MTPTPPLEPHLLDVHTGCASLWKPPGLPVFPPNHAEGPSLLDWWATQPAFPAAAFPAGFQGGLAHRLDTATSGLVLAALDPAMLEVLRGWFAARALRKLYVFHTLSCASGAPALAPAGPSLLVELPIGHHDKNRKKMVVADRPYRTCRGRWFPAWTRFTFLDILPDGRHRWQAEIRTGVTHQIRVHAAASGLALCGDPLYGSTPGEFLLHHARVGFPDGRWSPVAPLPDGSTPPLAIGGADGMV